MTRGLNRVLARLLVTTVGLSSLLLPPLALLQATPAHASAKGLDIRAWLMRDGVRAVAVEFYATWCGPCMEAIPRWRALHEKYRDQGFRLIVVNTMDPGGACVSVGWNPDKMVCDADGRIGRALGVGRKLPSAWLWTWQGEALVRGGDVGQVEQELRRHLRRNPRVAIEALSADGKLDEQIRVAVATELSMTGRMDVLAGGKELERLRKLRKESHGMGRNASQRCQLGGEMSANSLVRARVLGQGKQAKLSIALLSVETGCLLASTFVSYSPKHRARSVREAVYALMSRLRRPPQMPGGAAVTKARQVERHIGGGDGDWQPGQLDEVVVHMSSTPAGAAVTLDGKPLCPATPCSRSISRGRHVISMSAGARRATRSEPVQVKNGLRLKWQLKRSFATLYLDSQPAGLAVRLDGKAAGRTPIGPLEVQPGKHQVVIDDPCHFPRRESLQLQQSEQRSLTLKMAPRRAKLVVTARDAKGKAAVAEVWVDGRRLGTTGRQLQAPVCAEVVQARLGKRVAASGLDLHSDRIARVDLVFPVVGAIGVGAPKLAPRPKKAVSKAKDYWAGMPFAMAQFIEMRTRARTSHLDRNIDDKRGLAEGASRALSRLDPPRLLVPEQFYRKVMGQPIAEHLLTSQVYKLRAADPFVVVVAPEPGKRRLSDERILKLRAMRRLFRAALDRAWRGTAFNESDFARVLKHASEGGGGDASRVLIEAAQGYLASFDSHSALMSAQAWKDLSGGLRNTSFAGIGAVLTQRQGKTRIETPMVGRPAAKAGLRAGDIIETVDGKPLAGLTLAQVVGLIRGPAGSKVVLSVIRLGVRDPLRVPVRRAKIVIQNVSARMLKPHHPRIGYLKITGFVRGTAARVASAFAGLKGQRGGMAGLVVDLRNNSGGLLNEAQKVADLFVRKGLLVRLSSRTGTPRETMSKPGGIGESIPLAVLVNAGTASGAEIVAGAIQGNGRGLIVGQRTFGKGSTQALYNPSNRKDYYIKLTIGRFHTPLGPLQGVGILPDITVPKLPGAPMGLAWREEDFSRTRGVDKPPAASPNEARVDRLSPCVEAARRAEKLHAADPNPQLRFDYPLLKAADYLWCWR